MYKSHISDETVLVEVQGPDAKAVRTVQASPSHTVRDGTLTVSCSGILLGPSALQADGQSELLIVCPASVLLPFLDPHAREQPGSASKDAVSSHARIWVSVRGQDERFAAGLLGLCKMPEVEQSLQRLLQAPAVKRGDWRLGWAEQGMTPGAAAAVALLGVEISAPGRAAGSAAAGAAAVSGDEATAGAMCKVAASPVDVMVRHPQTGLAPGYVHGAEIMAAGAAFGTVSSRHFSPLLMRGVLASRVGRSLWLADMPCLPGMEGGPVGLGAHAPALCAMLLPSLTAGRRGGHEQCLAAPLVYVLAACTRIHSKKMALVSNRFDGTNRGSASPAMLSRAVHMAGACCVAVRHGVGGWASGVLVTAQGHILTVAHLLGHLPETATPATRRLEVAWLSDDAGDGANGRSSVTRWVPACLLHVFTAGLDLAVLQVDPGAMPKHAAAATLPPNDDRLAAAAGRAVQAAGHPTFNPASSVLSSHQLTLGTLAKVVLTKAGTPAMLVTSANVRSGCSGGPLFDAASGHLLGMITSNARHAVGVTYPRLNFAIPVNLLRPTIDALRAGDRCVDWGTLDRGHAELASLWSLRHADDDGEPKQAPLPAALRKLLNQQRRGDSSRL